MENEDKKEDVLSEPEGAEEKKGIEEGEPEGSQTPVPYSRFKKFHEQAKKAREEAEYWQREAERLRTSAPQSQPQAESLDPRWVQLYGDSEPARQAWKLQQELNQSLLDKARQEWRAEQAAEAQKVIKNEQDIDNRLSDFSEWMGRTLTDREEEELLDIVDEYTPKKEDGSYAGAMLSFDKAWEIYEMRNNVSQSSRRASRDAVADLSGTPSSGETNLKPDDDWTPGFGNWRRRFKNNN